MSIFGKKKKRDEDEETIQPIQPTPREKKGGKDGKDGNGHLPRQWAEELVQIIDSRVVQWQSSQPHVDPESYKDLRKYLYETPRDKMRQLTIRSPKRAALDPWLYMLAYTTNPRYFREEGWGRTKGDRDQHYGRRSGDLLPFLLAKEEEINRSKGGFLIQQTVGLTRLQTEMDEDQKHLSSPGY